MKTDRELLELASKAAGLDLEWCDFWGCMAKNLGVIDGFDRHTCWNPLQDDGDALRLAVKCGVCITTPHQFSKFNEKEMIVTVSWYEDGEKWVSEIFDGKDHDESLSRTRRAITRAAAQMQLNKEKNT